MRKNLPQHTQRIEDLLKDLKDEHKRIMVIGNTGVGKSSLLNSLTRYEMFETGDGF